MMFELELYSPPNPSVVQRSKETAVQRFKEEIEALARAQTKAIGRAVANLGMTTDESEAYDFRRAKILQLIENLRQLEKTP